MCKAFNEQYAPEAIVERDGGTRGRPFQEESRTICLVVKTIPYIPPGSYRCNPLAFFGTLPESAPMTAKGNDAHHPGKEVKELIERSPTT